MKLIHGKKKGGGGGGGGGLGHACRKGEEKKSAVAEHAWKEHHPIRWQETSVHVIDRASRFGELRVKEALHIHLTPEDQRFNRDVGLELPGCWISTLKALCVKPRPPPSD